MKKERIFLAIFALTPLLFGRAYSRVWSSLLVGGWDSAAALVWHGSPIVLLLFWFWVGRKYARARLPVPAVCAVLLGNSIGIASVLLSFADIVSGYFAPLTPYIVEIVVWLHLVDQLIRSVAVEMVIGLLLMLPLFMIGFLYEKKREK